MSTPNLPSPSAPSAPSALPSPSPIENVLSQAAAGLTFISETDAPLTPFFWPDAQALVSSPVASQDVARGAKLPSEAHIEQQSLDEFFEPAVAEEDWQNEDERAGARKFQALVATLKQNLRDSAVFRVGEVALDVYIVGRAEGGLAGLQTKVVET